MLLIQTLKLIGPEQQSELEEFIAQQFKILDEHVVSYLRNYFGTDRQTIEATKSHMKWLVEEGFSTDDEGEEENGPLTAYVAITAPAYGLSKLCQLLEKAMSQGVSPIVVHVYSRPLFDLMGEIIARSHKEEFDRQNARQIWEGFRQVFEYSFRLVNDGRNSKL